MANHIKYIRIDTIKIKKIAYYFLLVIIIGFFSTYLWKNQNHYPVPDSDFFQYIYDGNEYLNFNLHQNIQIPPVHPFLICVTAKIFKNTEYPELVAAHFINIILSTLTLLNIFLLLYQYSPTLSLVTVFLTATNKIFILNSLNVTNEITYGYFLTLILLLYQKKKSIFIYLLIGFLFLIRYESIVFLISIFIIEFFFNRKQFKLKNIFFAFLPIIVWLLVLNSHSSGYSILQNYYLKEIANGIKNIPNLKPFKELIDIIVFSSIDLLYFILVGPINFSHLPSLIIGYLFPSIIFLFFLFDFFGKKNDSTIKIIYLTMILHFLFLALFPNYYIRYQTPIIWILYLLIIDRFSKKSKIIIISALVIFNLFQLVQTSAYDNQTEKSEYRLTANWLNKQKMDEKTIIFIYDPSILRYFVNNPLITTDYSVYSTNSNIYTQCNNQIDCVINNIYNNHFYFSDISTSISYRNRKQSINNLTSIKNNISIKNGNIPDTCNKLIECIVNNTFIDNKNYNSFVISTNTSSREEDQVDDKFTELNLHHMVAFQDKILSKTDKLNFITTLGNSTTWAKIYQYKP